jgi:hypothetical protein
MELVSKDKEIFRFYRQPPLEVIRLAISIDKRDLNSKPVFYDVFIKSENEQF